MQLGERESAKSFFADGGGLYWRIHNMGKIPSELREIIAWNIRACRMQKFPGRGGGEKCAEAFGVSPQQWSPWERGGRTPDEMRLAQIADFFGVTVAWMRCDHRPKLAEPASQLLESQESDPGIGSQSLGADPTPPNMGNMREPFGGITGTNVPPPPLWEPSSPGSAASFYWLARHFFTLLEANGLCIRLDKQSLEYLAHCIKSS